MGQLRIDPLEFWRYTPAEIDIISKAHLERIKDEDMAWWQKGAWYTSMLLNAWGAKTTWKKLMPKFDKQSKPVDTKELDEKFEEAFKFHKSKCWTKIDGRNLKTIKVFGDSPDDLKRLERLKKEGKIRSKLEAFIEKRK